MNSGRTILSQVLDFVSKYDKDFNTGDFHRLSYVYKEEVDILVLTPDQLKFLIHDQEFEASLTMPEQHIKDVLYLNVLQDCVFQIFFID